MGQDQDATWGLEQTLPRDAVPGGPLGLVVYLPSENNMMVQQVPPVGLLACQWGF